MLEIHEFKNWTKSKVVWGAKIIGDCCGTKSKHLLSMRFTLENEDIGAVPSLEQIKLEIGSFSGQIRKLINKNKSKRRRHRVY